jgi:hypothetical protein
MDSDLNEEFVRETMDQLHRLHKENAELIQRLEDLEKYIQGLKCGKFQQPLG